ncbi:MAG: S1C family serine protease [Rhodospirillales bacterium]
MTAELQGLQGADTLAIVARGRVLREEGRLDTATRRLLGDLYVSAWVDAADKRVRKDKLARLLAAGSAVEEGLAPSRDPDLQFAFVEATSKSLLADGQIDFPAGIDVDLPADYERGLLDDVLDLPKGDGPRYAVVFQVLQARASRRVLNLRQVPSTLFYGFRTSSGSIYGAPAASELPQGVSTRDVAPGGEALGYLPSGSGSGDGGPKSLGSYSSGLGLGEPIFLRYTFEKAAIQARKFMTIDYYLIDRVAGRYFSSTIDVAEEERFEVAYNISSFDPRRAQHEEEFDTEKDVDDFEKVSMGVDLSKIVRHYLANSNKQKSFTGLASLRKEILGKKNKVLAKREDNRFDARPLADPRFDSVVAVYRGDGTMGSGFFITPRVVLTNWHVVENQKFVEMKAYDGTETYGSIIGKDVRLDMALVRVQSYGRPVKFYEKKQLHPGEMAEAIGHPNRLLFSITRGVVSAIRKHYSINLPRGAGDDVLYVQTDAPINGGNSGGPLFLGDRVIGMNTWGFVKDRFEGLNFAVHYGEILAYLREHFPEYERWQHGSNPS